MKWKPSQSQRRAFAERMRDPEEKAKYEARKLARAEKKRAGSRFGYETAGGKYVPTELQHNRAVLIVSNQSASSELKASANAVISGYLFDEKVHHDHIHIVNEWMRKNGADY